MISVRTERDSYEIRFSSLAEAMREIPPESFVITDANVQAAWGKAIPQTSKVKAVQPGEGSKAFDAYQDCLEWLADQKTPRKATIVALGGGVVGDLAGFVAATYMRGLPYIQIPTTLLSQVDSSVGGKTGIDLPQGKNLVGAFHPPMHVFICLETLETLPWREFANGMAEVWKYGFILDPELVRALQHHRLSATSPMLESIVRQCIEHKAAVVQEDERDLTGKRAILNFGHTVGHALEKLHNFQVLLHGEAIAIGMVAEAKLGELLQITEKGTSQAVADSLALDGLPITHDSLQHPKLVDAMYSDKKSEGGELAFSLITRIGECKLVRAVPRREVEAALCAL